MRQIVLDTETTGLEVEQQHRVIEIGCVEIFNRRLTGRSFHRYLNPERDIDEGAQQVHGLSRERLASEPKFAHIHAEFMEFVRDAELIIHNAPFDVAFLNAELGRVQAVENAALAATGVAAHAATRVKITDVCRVLDTLALARQMHPGQRNTLDALCKRYSVDNSHREYHGALLDARILAEVYLTMTGGQAKFTLSAESDTERSRARHAAPTRFAEGVRIAVVRASEAEMVAHEHVLALLDKASRGNTVWRKL
ncbi:MAG TPA: DNA polymerase III subunit epsilon [Steroidobacteraceae bacterium]|nr:DNA polymerase III subunit epsilon [Steroidobacteraceae bacterium]